MYSRLICRGASKLMTNEAKPESKLSQLLAILDVKRIVQVDDIFDVSAPIDEVIASILTLVDPQVISELKNVDFSLPEEIWQEDLRNYWSSIDEDAQRKVYREISQFLGGDDLSPKVRDAISQSILSEILEGIDIETLAISPKKWESQRGAIYSEAQEKRTLFLFDLDPEGTDGTGTKGLEYIRDALDDKNSHMFEIALISHWFKIDEEMERAEALAAEHKLDASQFVPISKQRLREDPQQFVYSIKLVLLNRYREAIVTKVSEAIKAANTKAIEKLKSLDIFTFEHLIFGSTIEEGSWVPDTLFRLVNALSRFEARNYVQADESITDIVAKVHKLWSIKSVPPANSRKSAQELIRIEMYEEGAYINTHRSPVALGDVFKHKNRYFILVGQPCDLVIRSDGNRSCTDKTAFLVEVVLKRPELRENNASYYFPIECFLPEDGRKGWVAFGKSYAVMLDVLDLCSISSSGEAKIELDSSAPLFLLEGQKPRFDKLRKFYSTIVEDDRNAREVLKSLEGSQKQTVDRMRRMLPPEASVSESFKPEVEEDSPTVKYKLQRVWRIRNPWAGEVLAEFSNYSARTAYEHDITRTLDTTVIEE